jgi:hypothetical protein
MRFPLFILLLASVTAHAAETASRTCRILFLNGPSDAPKTLYLSDGVSSQEVELPHMNFSPVYEIRSGALTLAMLPSPPVPRAGTTPEIPAEAPNAALTETITDFYLILSSDPDNKVAPVKIQVVNADVSNFKRGQMLWYNLTDTKVGGILGSRKLLIQPNSRLILDAPANGLEDYYVNIHFQPAGKTRAEPLCETRWTHDPRSRSVSFILKPTNSLIPRILCFSDFRTEKNSKPEATP